MRKFFILVIVILIFIAGYLTINYFEKPISFYKKTEITTGRVTDIKLQHHFSGRGFVQNVGYVYQVGNKYYSGHKTVDRRMGVQKIGNHVKVEYVVNDPQDSRAVEFFTDISFRRDKISYHYTRSAGYDQIDLQNRIFHYTAFGDSGKVISWYVGEYTHQNDTFFMTTFNFDGDSPKNFKFQEYSDPLGNDCLRDISTNEVYIKSE